MTTPGRPPVRPAFWVALGALWVLCVCVALSSFVSSLRRRTAERRAREKSERAKAVETRVERQAARIHVTLAPAPKGLPLLGEAGTGPDGYPLQYVDLPGLRALLAAQRFPELTD